MIRKTVQVTLFIDVTIDETKFNDEFLIDFRKHYYNFHGIDEHIEHLAQMRARGLYDNGDFIEGYGPTGDMGISFETINNATETRIS